MPKCSRLLALLFALALAASFVVCPTDVFAQATIATGNISGAITDPAAAVVPGAKITITSLATGAILSFTSTGAGTFNSGAIVPGDYTVRIEATSFKTTSVTTTVKVGATTPLNVQMELGSAEQVIEVTSEAVAVNSEQSTVQGVLTTEQIDNLPINGRNFLEVAQLEPGVQIQDASNFDPTKGGFTGISIGGRSGRTTRIEVDGLDISDETVGTSITNLSTSAIQEFQISQSSLDLSTELTTSGAVNVVTRSGSNTFHGEAFYLFRGNSVAANFTGGQDLPYQRNQFGGRFGGPIVKDRFFIFANVERVKQDLAAPIVHSDAVFLGLNGSSSSPFREVTSLLKADFSLPNGARLFYRLSYNNADGTTNTLPNYSTFLNTNNTPGHAWGADFSTGNFSHSFRVGYTKFVNAIGDASSRVNDLVPGAQVRVSSFRSGPNPLAPQGTFQSNLQSKYDGSWIHGAHTIRYGVGFNRIQGGGFANFFGIGPRLRSSTSAARQAFATDSCDPNTTVGGGPDLGDGLQPCFPGGATDPRNYPLVGTPGASPTIQIGNGQGFFTDLPGFGLPAGGQFDNRLQWYVGDTWKIKPNLTFSFGARYVRDTGRTNADLAEIPCSAISLSISPAPTTCTTGRLLDMFGPGLGDRVRQDNNNFGGNVGLVWDPWKNGKTVIRAGAGLVYDNAIFNNILFSRPLMLERGLFNAVLEPCPGGVLQFPTGPVTMTPGGLDLATQVCGRALGQVASEVIALQSQFQAAVAAAGPTGNPSFVGNILNAAQTHGNLLNPNYRTPYSFQMNVGIQRELKPGLVVSVDYVRNVSLRYLLFADTNLVGDSRFINMTAAQNAIAATLADCGAATIDAAIASCASNPLAAGATIDNFASFGLGSGKSLLGGESVLVAAGVSPDFGPAFAGINPEVGSNDMLSPVGRSVYSALQMSLRGKLSKPLPGLKSVNLQSSYSLSRFLTQAAGADVGDQDFINAAVNAREQGRFFGPSSFDRTHQFSVGAVFEFPKFVRMSLISHHRSPLASTLFMEDGGRAGEIFHTDLDGDGTVGDLLSGTDIGEFRYSGLGGLVDLVSAHNSNVAGTFTPAGQALVDAGLFTSAQLTSLGAVVDSVPAPIADSIGLDWLHTLDAKLTFPIKLGEKFTIEPNVGVYNLFNFANFDTSPSVRLTGLLDGSEGSLGSTTLPEVRDGVRASQSSGVFSLGAARQVEFGLRITW